MRLQFPKLNLPFPSLKIKEVDSNLEVWDIVRQKYIILTPEEWVRQHWIHLLYDSYGYPISLMRVEKLANSLSTRSLRFDMICCNRQGENLILLELKAPHIPLNDQVLMQAMEYDSAPLIILSNGVEHILYQWDIEKKTYEKAEKLPHYKL